MKDKIILNQQLDQELMNNVRLDYKSIYLSPNAFFTSGGI